MTADEARRIATARALMLGSTDYPPAAHLPYLTAHGPHTGAGLGRHPLGDRVVRDVALPAEQPELVRVLSETFVTFGQVGQMLTPGAVNSTPARLLAASLVWFGVERAGRLVGLHGGFFWDAQVWVRRFQSLLEPGGGTWETIFQLEATLYAHLWRLGMREVLMLVPMVPEFLDRRRATGWEDSHEVHFAGNARPFMWLRKALLYAPELPDPDQAAVPRTWQAET